ncbi:MAG: TIGR03560 family F420-dependent LLM class oxidoreductase [Acidimicrobiia bacterium]
MRFSVWLTGRQPWTSMIDAARHAGATGWDGIWFADHFMAVDNMETPTLEVWTTATAVAMAVPNVRIGTLVLGNTYRHPAVVAKMATTLDVVSGGRAVLGLGTGWQENEHEAYGIELPSIKERLERFDEACTVINGLLTQTRTDFDGRHYTLRDATCEPKGVNGKVPLLIGGGGEKVMLKLVARHADEWNTWGDPNLMASKGAVLDAHCEASGRDPKTIKHSANANVFCSRDESVLAPWRGKRLQGRPTLVGTPSEIIDLMGAYQEAGVEEFIVPDFNVTELGAKLELFDLLMDDVVRPLRR